MPTINVKLCSSCLQSLLHNNPFIDKHNRPISFKGVKLRKVSAPLCDCRVGDKCRTHSIELTAMRCGNCNNEYFIRLVGKQKAICPSCRSMHMIPIRDEDLQL